LDFSKYLKFEKGEIRLKNRGKKAAQTINRPKNMHMKFPNDWGMGTLLKIGGTKMEGRRIP